MPRSRIPSPSRSQGVISTPRRSIRRSRSVTSPARSNKSTRLSAVIASSFNLSPVPNRQSVLTDNTDVEIPTRRSWWKKLGESSTDVMEFLKNEDNAGTDNVIEELNVEVLSQRPFEENLHKYHTDIPDSSDGESICSIVIPHHKFFSQKVTAPQQKFGQFINNRDLINLQKSHVDHDKDIAVAPKNLFNQASKVRNIPAFPAALLSISGNKTVDKTKEMLPPETHMQGRGLFGNRVAKKRNMFADFILSDSEDEISDIQLRKFGFPKKVCTDKGDTPRGPQPSSSFDMDDWALLPSSTMVENQLDETTPLKQVRPSILSEENEPEIHKELSILEESIKHVSQSNSRTTRSKSKSIQQTTLNKTNSTKATDKSSETISKKLGNDKDINVDQEINDDNDVTITTTSRQKSKNTSNKLQDSLNKEIDKSKRSTRNGNKSIQNVSLNEMNSKITEVSNRIEKQKDNDIINTKDKQNLNVTKNTDNANSLSIQQKQIEENIEKGENTPAADFEGSIDDQEIILNQEENKHLDSERTKQNNQNTSAEHEKLDEKEHNKTYKYPNQNENNDKERKVVDGKYENETERNEQDVNEEEEQNGSEDKDQVISEAEEKDDSQGEEQNNEEIMSEAEEENDSESEEQIISEAEEQIDSKSEEQIDSEAEEKINSEAEEQIIRETEERNISMDEGQNDNNIDDQNIKEVQEKNECDSHKNKTQLQTNVPNKSDRQIDDGDNDNEPNISHNTTGIHGNKEEAEMVLHDKTNQIETTECFSGRLTTLRKSSIMLKNLNLRPSLIPENNSTGLSDGTKDSSANNSGWDSHRTTRKTLRQTFGKDFTPRKSLRTLVMEKSAKRQTNFDQDNKQPSIVDTKQTNIESLENKNEEQTCTKNIDNSQTSMETMLKYQTSGETVHQIQISNKDMDRNQASLEDIEQNLTSLNDMDQNQISMEDIDQNQSSSEDMDKNKSSIEDVDQNQTSIEDMDQNESNMEVVDQNESNIEDVDQNESNMDDVEQNQTSMEEINQNETNMEDVDQNELNIEDVEQNESNMDDVEQNQTSMEDMDQNESNMEDVDQNESNIENVEQNESNIENVEQNESNIEDVDQNESNIEDVDQNESNIEDVDQNESNMDDVEENQTSMEEMDQNESSDEDMDENQISIEDINENQASMDNRDSNQRNMESLSERGRNSMDFTTKEHLADTTNKRHTNYTEFGDHTIRNAVPLANSTKFHHFESYRENEHDDADETDQEVVKQKRQATLEVYLKKIREENNERKRKLDEEVKTSLKQPAFTFFKVPQKPVRPIKIQNQKPKPKKPVSTILPPEVLEDMKYKPPKRFKPSNASWITKRLYKFLETKLEPKYDYKARVRAEKLVETIYNFTKDIRRHHPTAPAHLVEALKVEMARLDIVKTHFQFYQFFHDYMPREVRIKVVPDIVNKIPPPKHGVFSDIIII